MCYLREIKPISLKTLSIQHLVPTLGCCEDGIGGLDSFRGYNRHPQCKSVIKQSSNEFLPPVLIHREPNVVAVYTCLVITHTDIELARLASCLMSVELNDDNVDLKCGRTQQPLTLYEPRPIEPGE